APSIQTYSGSPYALLILADVRPETRILIAPVADAVANKAHWRPVAEFEDEVTGAEIDGDSLYLLANKGHPRGRILKTPTSAPSLATAAEVVPQGPLVIEQLQRARDNLYLQMMDGGVSRLRRLSRSGVV